MLPPCGLGEAWRCCLSRRDTSGGPSCATSRTGYSRSWPASGGEALGARRHFESGVVEAAEHDRAGVGRGPFSIEARTGSALVYWVAIAASAQMTDTVSVAPAVSAAAVASQPVVPRG
jgi:hypothetical protein